MKTQTKEDRTLANPAHMNNFTPAFGSRVTLDELSRLSPSICHATHTAPDTFLGGLDPETPYTGELPTEPATVVCRYTEFDGATIDLRWGNRCELGSIRATVALSRPL